MNEFIVTIKEKKLRVAFTGDNKASVDGKEYNYSLSKLNNNTYKLFVDNKSFLITARKNGGSEFIVTLEGQVIETKVLSALKEKAANLIEAKAAKHSITIVKSPMPGMILKIKKKAGDEVMQGDSVLILEAMKMENDIRSPVSGKIKEVKIIEGQAVEKGISLLVIE
ncbi:MAG: biotin/lipoyl-containing protein [Ignavibacteria bacterium]|nr:biotin/lipoyl-containing protein [Ignavibacteria bacterium]